MIFARRPNTDNGEKNKEVLVSCEVLEKLVKTICNLREKKNLENNYESNISSLTVSQFYI